MCVCLDRLHLSKRVIFMRQFPIAMLPFDIPLQLTGRDIAQLKMMSKIAMDRSNGDSDQIHDQEDAQLVLHEAHVNATNAAVTSTAATRAEQHAAQQQREVTSRDPRRTLGAFQVVSRCHSLQSS